MLVAVELSLGVQLELSCSSRFVIAPGLEPGFGGSVHLGNVSPDEYDEDGNNKLLKLQTRG